MDIFLYHLQYVKSWIYWSDIDFLYLCFSLRKQTEPSTIIQSILPVSNSPQTTSDADHRRTLDRLDRFSYWTDSNIRVPIIGFRFGLSPLIGLVPGIGDFVGLILSLYVYREAQKVGADRKVKRKIIQNMLIEFVVGLIPVIGDAFDAVFKANTRNTQLLRNYLYKELGEEPDQGFPWFAFIVLCFLIALLITLIVWFI